MVQARCLRCDMAWSYTWHAVVRLARRSTCQRGCESRPMTVPLPFLDSMRGVLIYETRTQREERKRCEPVGVGVGVGAHRGCPSEGTVSIDDDFRERSRRTRQTRSETYGNPTGSGKTKARKSRCPASQPASQVLPKGASDMSASSGSRTLFPRLDECWTSNIRILSTC